jgi:hypothetical protein
MPTPRLGYYAKDGSRLPGVTTILSRFKDSGGLIHWSWNIAHEGLLQSRGLLARALAGEAKRSELRTFLEQPIDRWDYRARREKAADAGTCAHAMAEAFIRGKAFDDSAFPVDAIDAARPAFAAFCEWAEQTRLQPAEPELALISERHRFGGTLDLMLIGGKRALGDIKTANAVYGDNLCQIGAYGLAWDENRPAEPIDGGFHLLRFSKQAAPDDPIHFSHHWWSQLEVAQRAFLQMRELYDLVKRLEKLAA